STPLRTDPATGAVVPGLCTAWKASPDFRRWTFTCRSAPSIAAALRRVVRLGRAPARWLFVDAFHIGAPTESSLVVQLEQPWRRFPYALTAVAHAPGPGRRRLPRPPVATRAPQRVLADGRPRGLRTARSRARRFRCVRPRGSRRAQGPGQFSRSAETHPVTSPGAGADRRPAGSS